MRVVVVPVFEDNFAYLLIDDSTQQAAAIDPAVPETVLAAIQKENVKVTHILTTHHHLDHSGGNEGMAKAIEGVEVVGGDDRIGALNNKVSHLDQFELGSLKIQALSTPCHTSGHLLYFVTDSKAPEQAPVLFTGDTLFVGGCGRFFEGNGEQMDHALNTVVAGLPHHTQVYVGHEYTVGNLKFAASVEPENQQVTNKLKWAEEQVSNKIPTVPSSVEAELSFNPFMRVNTMAIRKAVKLDSTASAAQVMDALREAKNNFKA